MLNYIIYGIVFKLFPCGIYYRPDLMDNYLALILSAFIRNGLLEVRLTNLILFYFISSNRILSEQQTFV